MPTMFKSSRKGIFELFSPVYVSTSFFRFYVYAVYKNCYLELYL